MQWHKPKISLTIQSFCLLKINLMKCCLLQNTDSRNFFCVYLFIARTQFYISTAEHFLKNDKTGSDQPHVALPAKDVCVQQSHHELVQSSSCSHAVLFRCEEQFVLSG